MRIKIMTYYELWLVQVPSEIAWGMFQYKDIISMYRYFLIKIRQFHIFITEIPIPLPSYKDSRYKGKMNSWPYYL